VKGQAGNEGFTERGINTFNDPPKNKNMQTDHILHSDASAFASTWDLYDTYSALQALQGAPIYTHIHFTLHWILQGSVVTQTVLGGLINQLSYILHYVEFYKVV